MAFEASIKYSFTPKEVAERKAKERKINLLLLIQHFLKSEGYIESYYQLINESKLPKDYEICDNMELNNILQDYETYYFIRFQKYPKIYKKVSLVETPEKKTPIKPKKPMVKELKKESSQESADLLIASSLCISPIKQEQAEIPQPIEEKLFRPLGSFEGYSDEWKSLASVISQDIVEKKLNVKWEDVIGLNGAKSYLKEAIVYPMKYPALYQEALSPWKGLLLYGPSGTGKTLLAKAVASECQTTFFNISASSIVSKWRGDSEKLVRVMFDLARLEAPSTIFVDELDAIGSRRDCSHEHEASRRLKSELLVQLDGLCQTSKNVFFLTTSNLPWDLDFAILRRLEKRIFVGLPDQTDCQKLIEMYLPAKILNSPLLTSEIDYKMQASKCESYSGADIKLLCKEVKMAAMRQLFSELEKDNSSGKIKLKPITNEDFDKGRARVKSSVSDSLAQYIAWMNQHGT